MKKMISLLSVALFALTFAAGCGKLAKCSDAKTQADCTDSKKFEQIDKKDQVCKWTGTAGKTADEQKTQGTCADDASGETPAQKAAKECAALTAGGQAGCDAKNPTAADATLKCVYKAAVVADPAANPPVAAAAAVCEAKAL